ncbi:hypothetical protein EV182_000444 [Spiromyces aspiralis]|uniref:Uncharacterized protein n=1 Tax=Spiromyces aspiralis TaxID=68401 RepID=A0ACC1HPH4_9FUNG|nr:hypothetical protein EV182_000444 [Spiromyces aspiralis]
MKYLILLAPLALISALTGAQQEQVIFGPVAEMQASFDPRIVGQHLLSEVTRRLGGLEDAVQKIYKQLSLDEHKPTTATATAGSDGTGLYSTKRLIQTDPHHPARWMTEDDIHTLRRLGVRFMDVTNHGDGAISLLGAAPSQRPKQFDIPTKLAHQDAVHPIATNLTTVFMQSTLNEFTNKFYNRYYNSVNGKRSSAWLLTQVQALIDGAGSKANVTARHFEHSFPQSSIIARFEGSSLPEETVIISAHLDSVNMWIPWFGRAPGADDNGSGTVSILETFRGLLEHGFQPERSVEFHWYAGEEGGLLGSQDIAKAYYKDGRQVVGQLHFDMTGFFKRENGEVIGVAIDNTDPELSDLLRLLAKTYTRLETSDLSCGYACSDHASWNKYGYRSAMAFESDLLEANTHVHTPEDTIDTLDFDHMLEYSKVAVGYAFEIGNPGAK